MLTFPLVSLALNAATFQSIDLPKPPSDPIPNLPAGLPSGDLVVDNVPFRLGPRICVAGIQDARAGKLFPTETRIALDRKAAVLHLLHGVDGTDKDGVPLLSLVLHYPDGGRESVRLAYGIHARSLLPAREESDILHDPNSSVAWSGTNRMARVGGATRVFHTPIVNPRPDEPIAAIELISLFSRSTPVIFAITAEERKGAVPSVELPLNRVVRKAREFDDDVYHSRIVVRTADADGKAVVGAEATLVVTDLEGTYYFGRTRADTSGKAVLSVPRQHAAGITVVVRANGRIPFVHESPRNAAGRLPAEIVATLKIGEAGGGVVQDPTGRPIAGALVGIYHLKVVSSKEYARLDHDTLTTDADGRWRSTALPAEIDGFQFSFAHPDFRPKVYALATTVRNSRTASPFVFAKEDIQGTKAAATLEPGLRIVGLTRNASGEPVAGAEIRLSPASRSSPDPADDEIVLRSDAKGGFKVSVLLGGQWNAVVLADGYAPVVHGFTLVDGRELPKLDLVLTAGRQFVGHVADQVQQPIAGAKVRLESWNDTPLVRFEAETDERGTFTWTNAPDGQLRFYLSAPDHTSSTYSLSGTTEHRFTLRKLPSVRGTVVDAETRQPISDFSVYRGRAYNRGEPIRWERYNTFRGRNGEYNVRLVDYGSDSRTAVLVEAPGYMPAASPPITKPGLYTNNFALKKTSGLAGRVLDATGNPVSAVSLVLLEPAEQAYLRINGDFSRSSDSGVAARSDRMGGFQFAPRLEPHTILASHDKGFAEVRVTNPTAPATIVLQPWARITGKVVLPKVAGRAHSVRLENATYRYLDSTRQGQALSVYLNVEAQEDGSFGFERVPPGDRRVAISHSVAIGDSTRSMSSHGVPLVLEPGQSTNVVVGAQGRTIRGTMVVLGGEPEDVDWKRDFHSLTPNRVLNMNLPAMDYSTAKTDAERQALAERQQLAELAFWQTPEGRAYERGQVSYLLQFETNGTFWVDGVPPGKYSLQVSPTDPSRTGYNYDQIGTFSREVEVPPARPAEASQPIDLGKMEIAIRSNMRIGKKAPRFSVSSFDGKELKLDDFRGRHVLIDFWATWSGNRSYDLRQLKLVQERYGKDSRLAMVGVNLDYVQQTAEQELKNNPLPWPQCSGGNWNTSTVRNLFGLRNLPDCVLIDAEGKIAGFNLRGLNILRTVERVLGEPKIQP